MTSVDELQPMADVKRAANLKARAALAGVTVLESQDEHGRPEWIVTKWHLTRSVSSLDELHAWLDRVVGKQR